LSSFFSPADASALDGDGSFKSSNCFCAQEQFIGFIFLRFADLAPHGFMVPISGSSQRGYLRASAWFGGSLEGNMLRKKKSNQAMQQTAGRRTPHFT
jgi:hypothetical protein